ARRERFHHLPHPRAARGGRRAVARAPGGRSRVSPGGGGRPRPPHVLELRDGGRPVARGSPGALAPGRAPPRLRPRSHALRHQRALRRLQSARRLKGAPRQPPSAGKKVALPNTNTVPITRLNVAVSSATVT